MFSSLYLGGIYCLTDFKFFAILKKFFPNLSKNVILDATTEESVKCFTRHHYQPWLQFIFSLLLKHAVILTLDRSLWGAAFCKHGSDGKYSM